MPETYAHYRMGQAVRKYIGGKEKEIIEKYPELFLIGLHGPDILFYYKPLQSNVVNKTGYGMHERSGALFFERAAKIARKYKNHGAYLAYIYGYICHFALDVSCHGYIDEKIEKSGISHAEIETELDRELMVKDGWDPIRKKTSGHIVPSEKNAAIIQAFYPGINERQIEKSLRGMVFYTNFLVAPGKMKRSVIYTFLKMTGHYESMQGQIVNYKKNPECADSTEKLMSLYKDAEKLAVQLIYEYRGFLKGSEKLNKIYHYNFGSQLVGSEKKQKVPEY
ncbi:MAG: zinc dependent phospholipase C family protein [Hespellia sp.]|nr:zinc dependent phospholipase C family protein [Hespellia sp.]